MENNSTIEQSRNTPKGDAQSVPKGWVETTLGEVVKIYSGKTRPKENGIYPIYGGNGILNYGNKYNQENDTIIIGRVGAYCGNIFSEKNKFWLSDNALGVKNNSKSDVSYLYYKLIYLKLNNHSIGGAQPLLTQGLLKKLEITIPKSISEQKAIAQILTAFDDKIELLQAQNKTLETTAQTIFKEWFGKYQIGDELPEGWRVGKLGDICIIKNGYAFKSKDYVDKGVSIVRTTNFKNETIDLNTNQVFLTEEKSKEYEKFFLNKFDHLLVMVGASIGKNVITPSKVLPSLQNQNMWNFKIKKQDLKFYCIFLVRKMIKEQLNSASGSARDFFRKDYFYNLDIIIPNEEILFRFSSIVRIIFEKKDINYTQIQTLKQTRDTLLPKLMSGQLRVDEFKERAV
jgi:type I restriction enzyme S subunit